MKSKTMTAKTPKMIENGIRVAIAPAGGAEATRGMLDNAGRKLDSVVLIASDKLARNLKAFSEQFGAALASLAKVSGDYRLDEVKVKVELGVEGQITLLGSGASASGKAGLEMTFKRAKPTL